MASSKELNYFIEKSQKIQWKTDKIGVGSTQNFRCKKNPLQKCYEDKRIHQSINDTCDTFWNLMVNGWSEIKCWIGKDYSFRFVIQSNMNGQWQLKKQQIFTDSFISDSVRQWINQKWILFKNKFTQVVMWN